MYGGCRGGGNGGVGVAMAWLGRLAGAFAFAPHVPLRLAQHVRGERAQQALHEGEMLVLSGLRDEF